MKAEGEETTSKCPAASELEDSALSRVLPPSVFKSIAQMNTSGSCLWSSLQFHSRASDSSCSDRHPAQLTSKTSRKIHPRSNHLLFQEQPLMLTGTRVQLLPYQACGRLPWLLPVPRYSQVPGKWMDLLHPSTSHFTCHNGEINWADRGPSRSSHSGGQGPGLWLGCNPGFEFQMGDY